MEATEGATAERPLEAGPDASAADGAPLAPPHWSMAPSAPKRTRSPKEPPTPELVRRSVLLLLTALAVGLVVDLGLRGGLIGVGSALAITAVAAGLLVLAPDRTAERWVFAGLAVVAAAGLVLRTSPWIVVLDWLAAIGLLGLAASVGGDRPLLGSSLSRLLWRSSGPPLIGSMMGPTELWSAADAVRRRPRPDQPTSSAIRRVAPAVGRGLLIAVPILLVLGLLLASADGVFASFFDVPVPDVGSPLLHLFLVGLGAAVVAGLARWARKPVDPDGSLSRSLGSVETIVVLSGLALLYGLFAVAQLIASSGGEERVVETTGLTYAEYARSGFFQLLWAAAITIAVLLGIRAVTRPGGPRSQVAIRVVSAITCALTLVVVAAAIIRLNLYREAYGLTMLRLACTTFAWVLAVAFVLLGARMLQSRGRDWLPVAYLGLAVSALAWWNVSNPEVTVVETNLARAIDTGKLDVDYLDTLSDDALPALVDGIDDLPSPHAADLQNRLCSPSVDIEVFGVDPYGRPHVEIDQDGVVRARPGWLAYNASRRAAVDALQRCADSLPVG